MVLTGIDSVEDYFRSKGFTLCELCERLGLDDSELAYASGSLIEGKGNLNSDLDVYVLTSQERLISRQDTFSTERKHQQSRRNFGIVYLKMGELEVDAEFHLWQKFQDLINTLNAMEPTDPEEINQSFDSLGRYERLEALELLHRLRVAKPLNNEKAFFALRSSLDDRKYLLWNIHYYLIQVQDAQKGTRRSLKEGDIESAYLKLTRLYDNLADAYLFSCDRSLDRWKWRLPKLRAVGNPKFLQEYLDVQLLKEVDVKGLHRFVEEKLESSFIVAEKVHTQLKLGKLG